MRQSLQSKFNLLGLLLVAFFLLMLPMFSQVKADTRESLKEAKNTSLYKWSRDIAKDFKPPEDLENTQVEDYWDDYQEQAREANPDCPACNPDADADGDNVTNKDEVEQGRNPLCNEDEYSVEYCQNADKNNITDPDDVLAKVPRVPLANLTWSAPEDCSPGLLVEETCPLPFWANNTFRSIEAYLNVSGYQGFSWSLVLMHETGSVPWEESGCWGSSTPPTSPVTCSGTRRAESPPMGNYTANLELSGGATGVQGTWNLMVYGIR